MKFITLCILFIDSILKKKLISDEKLINFLSDLWNSEFKKIFNLEVKSDNEGCLQDIHWFQVI